MANNLSLTGETKSHQYHLVDPSPWPILVSFAALGFFAGLVLLMHKNFIVGYPVFGISFLSLLFFGYTWWRDVLKEATKDKAHTTPVRNGLKIGMQLFILSEAMIFFAFFFLIFNFKIFPAGLLEDIWVTGQGVYPPLETKTINPFSLPLLNTLILLLSSCSLSWAHYVLMHDHDNRRDFLRGTLFAVILGFIFLGLQAVEYVEAVRHHFGFKDNSYSSAFYMVTGFHGFHVFVGAVFLLICYLRGRKGHFTKENHLGFEFAAWYWHFVDAIWIFLFFFLYIWVS